MRIVHIIFSFTIGGAEAMLVDIVNEQINYAKVSVIIINNEINHELLEKIDKRINVFIVGRKKKSKNPLPILKLNYYLFLIKPNIVHCHIQNIIPLLVLYKKRAVLTVHDSRINHVNFHKYHKLFAISKCVGNYIFSKTNLNSDLVYNGINLNMIKSKANYSKSAIFKIILISRLDHMKKGQHLAIEAVKLLRDKDIKDIQLNIIGIGESEIYLKKLVVEYNINDQVNFLGLKNREYVYDNLKNYDLLIQPSIFEGFGLTVVEGMVAKVPVLVSDIEGPMEIINWGEFGYFFKSESVKELADKIEQIKNEREDSIQDVVDRAFYHAIHEFNIINTAKKYFNLYQE